jgi:hypothetical protein
VSSSGPITFGCDFTTPGAQSCYVYKNLTLAAADQMGLAQACTGQLGTIVTTCPMSELTPFECCHTCPLP